MGMRNHVKFDDVQTKGGAITEKNIILPLTLQNKLFFNMHAYKWPEILIKREQLLFYTISDKLKSI